MNCPQFGAVGSIDVLNVAMVIKPDVPQVAETIIFYHVYVAIQVHVECAIGIIAVLVVVGIAVIEVRCPCVCQCLFCIVLNRLQLISVSGDNEAVYHPILVQIVHTVALNPGDVAVLVVFHPFGISVGGIDVREERIALLVVNGNQAKGHGLFSCHLTDKLFAHALQHEGIQNRQLRELAFGQPIHSVIGIIISTHVVLAWHLPCHRRDRAVVKRVARVVLAIELLLEASRRSDLLNPPV